MKQPMKRHGYLRDPSKARANEKIGGGVFVFRRDANGRVRAPIYPFEHGGIDAAKAQADILARANPGVHFDIVAVLGSAFVQVEHREAAE